MRNIRSEPGISGTIKVQCVPRVSYITHLLPFVDGASATKTQGRDPKEVGTGKGPLFPGFGVRVDLRLGSKEVT